MTLADSARRAGYRLNRFETLGSTNDEALRRAAAGDRGHLWIVAAAQSSGRGRQGRCWTSPPGNLYASLLLVDPVEPARAGQIGFLAGVALADAVTGLVGARVGEARRIVIKWPNDLLSGDAKVAGVLVEGTRMPSGRFAVVLGFGVNCASHPAGTPYPATHLHAIDAMAPSPDAVFAALSARLPEVLALWDQGRGFEAVRTAWLARALRPGTRMSVNHKGQRRSGCFESIDAQGRLILATPEGPALIDVGDVLLAEAPTAVG